MSHPSAIVIILPPSPRARLNEPDFDEQRVREVTAKIAARRIAPPRSRPFLFIDNDKPEQS